MARPTEDKRPDPTALLQLAAREGRGKLTIFLGAAPGVGKTYTMLERARSLLAEGMDVVIGLVETHGRSETARLAEGIEVLPRRGADGPYGEFDLDAALVRRPGLLIVDELAHSNAAGSRHPKRHQDIAELVAAGINVWTALNIQHLESLSDLVSRIAGIPVRETVPDIVLKAADEIILVDLPPAELISRLHAGKVYLPDNAKRALEGFFQPAILTALRELALRRVADRVDDQMVDFLRQSALEGPWATGERLLVCIGPDGSAEKLVRVASRLASGLNARLLVLSLSRPGAALPDAGDAERLEQTLRLAERLGAETRRDTAPDFVEAILRIARREHITQIVIGRPVGGRWFRRSLPDALLRRAGEIGVHIVPGLDNAAARAPRRRLTLPEWGMTIGLPVVSVGATTLFGLGITALVALQNLSMLYLAAVLLSAVIAGRGSALLAAVLSFFAYNLFFIEPTGALTVAQPQEVLSLVIFIAVALAAGQLAARLRESADLARQQARQSQALLDFSRKLSAARGHDSVLDAIASHLNTSLTRPAVVLTASEETSELELSAAWPPDQLLDSTEMTAARWAFDKKEPAGFLTGTLPQVRYIFRPIISAQRLLGVAGLAMGSRDVPLAADEERTWVALLDQAAIAMDRARLNRESALASVAREGEKVQAALLSSLSHDLRTPLASITGAVTTLRHLGEKLPVETRDDLLLSIEEESSRLNRFVANLFDMTRIEAGIMKAKRDSIDLAGIIEKSAARACRLHADLKIEISLAPNLPKAIGDAALLEQVLFNLLDNARKYGGSGLPVSIFARADDGMAIVSVTDQGKGIPEIDLEKIFDKFYRRTKGDGRPAGTGLGLSIARGLMTAMGGSIRATSPANRKRHPIHDPTTLGRRRDVKLMLQRILVVDDEPQIHRFLKPALIAAGFDVETALTAAEARRMAATRSPDLIVLDLGLPDGDGKSVIETVRVFSNVPIIVLSARDQDIEKIESLDLGADDYVEKPFSIGELLARIRVALRHATPKSPQQTEQRFGDIELDVARHLVTVTDRPVHLTPKEFELFALLASNAGRVVTHQLALTQVWGAGHRDDTQYLRVVIGQLRAKLEADPKIPRHIITETGIGYRLVG